MDGPYIRGVSKPAEGGEGRRGGGGGGLMGRWAVKAQ